MSLFWKIKLKTKEKILIFCIIIDITFAIAFGLAASVSFIWGQVLGMYVMYRILSESARVILANTIQEVAAVTKIEDLRHGKQRKK